MLKYILDWEFTRVEKTIFSHDMTTLSYPRSKMIYSMGNASEARSGKVRLDLNRYNQNRTHHFEQSVLISLTCGTVVSSDVPHVASTGIGSCLLELISFLVSMFEAVSIRLKRIIGSIKLKVIWSSLMLHKIFAPIS